jgi:hypothetical protein
MSYARLFAPPSSAQRPQILLSFSACLLYADGVTWLPTPAVERQIFNTNRKVVEAGLLPAKATGSF